MCYTVEQLENRVERKAVRDRILKESQLGIDFHVANAFTHPDLFVMTGEQPYRFRLMRWGLIPSWCKDAEKAKELQDYTPNAKSETVFEKPSFRSILQRRCVLPVGGFYEWMEFKKKKYPHYIYPAEGEMFSLGCLWDSWVDKETGEVLDTFSIVTTEANPLMARIHNVKKRMPLILREEEEKRWVDPDLPKEMIQALMKPYDEKLMRAHTISKRITSRKENPNVAEVKEMFEYAELRGSF